MKKKTICLNVLYLMTSAILMHGCAANRQNTDESATTIVFDELKGNDLAFVDFKIEKTEIIPLETNPDCLVDNVKSIIPYQDEYFVQTNSRLLKFSNTGKFITHIGERGNGPGEFNMIDNFCILRDSLYLFDGNMEKVLVFDLKGNFGRQINDIRNIKFSIGTVPLGTEAILIAKSINFDDQDCLYAVWNPDIPNKMESVMTTSLVSDGSYSYSPHPMAIDGEGVLFFAPFGNAIYEYDPQKHEVAQVFDLTSVGFNTDNGNDYPELWNKALSSGNKLILSLFNTDRYLFINLYNGSVVWDKTMKRGTYLETGEYRPEDSEAPFYPLLANYSSGNQIISVRAAADLNHPDASNPVIVKYTVNK